MSRLALYFLGPPRIELDGEPVHIGRRKAIALLAYLAVTGQSHGRDTLAALLWPEYDQSRARADLRRTLSLLNRALGQGWLTADRESAGLDPDADLWLDVDEFRQRLTACETHGHLVSEVCPECVPALEEAVGLYRDDFLAGFTLTDSLAFDEWQFFQTKGLRDEMAGSLQRLVHWYRRQDEYGPAIAYARRWLAVDPLHEPAHRRLMALYAQAGQQAAALRQYQLCEETLAEELGLSPSEETRTLFDRIRAREEIGPEREAPLPPHKLPPQPTPLQPPRHNLPLQPTSFVGRERELARLAGALADPELRLVTVTGPGGMGKTRLALEAAMGQLEAFRDGVWLVRLAPLGESVAVPEAVASALRVPTQPGQSLRETVIDSLRLRHILLLVDNCEHVLAGAACMVDLILAYCPNVTVLATSREPLRIPGEHLYPVTPLALPEPEATIDGTRSAAACRLFLSRARAVRPDFQIDDGNAIAIGQICRRLDGMPLAIELAAARLRAFSPQEIVSRLGRHLDRLDDRFRLLTDGSRTAEPRQQTLLNTVDWSYALLTEAEQALFSRLSVFRGGFTLHAAEQVCAWESMTGATVSELLASLVDKSLLQTVDAADGVTRYDLLETLRQFGQARLEERGELENVRERHALFYAALAKEAEPELHTAKQREWWRQLDPEEDNIRAAVSWLLACGRVELALRLLGDSVFWWGRGHISSPGLQWLLEGLAKVERVAPAVRAKALWGAGFLTWRDVGDQDRAQTLLEESLALNHRLEDDKQISLCTYLLGLVADARGESQRARRLYRESLALSREAGDEFVETSALPRLAMHEEPERAEDLFHQAVALSQKIEWPWMIGWAYIHWGQYAQQQGDLIRTRGFFYEALTQYRLIDSPIDLAVAYGALSMVTILTGDYAGAKALLAERLAWCRGLGLPTWSAGAIWSTGFLAWREGDIEEARRHLAEGLEIARQHAHDWVLLCEMLLGLLIATRDSGAYPEAEALCQEGLILADQQDSRFWRAAFLGAQGSIAHRRGDSPTALDLHRQALRLQRDGADRIAILSRLEETAWALVGVGGYDPAARLLAWCANGREQTGLVLAYPEQPHHDHAVATLRQAPGEAVFTEAWVRGAALTLEEAIDLAMAAGVKSERHT